MRMFKRNILVYFIALLPFVIFLVIMGRITSSVDNSSDIVHFSPSVKSSKFRLTAYLKDVNAETLEQKFPYSIYLDSGNWQSIASIKQDIHTLDSVNHKDSSLNRKIISIALNKRLEQKTGANYTHYHADSVIKLLQWAEKFNAYAEVDPDNETLYGSIYNHWMNFIANKLTDYSNENKSIKYDFKFRYVLAQCMANQFNTSIHYSSTEKVIMDAQAGKWGYLYGRIWLLTPWYGKALAFLFLFITLYGYYSIIRLQIIKKRK